MMDRNKKLDQLLNNIEIESPSVDFTNDIMEMISNSALDLNDISVEKEKAPMHLTDLVMDDIEVNTNKSHSLISKKDFHKMAIIIAIGIILTLFQEQAYFQTNSFNFDFKPNKSLILLVGGSVLWIVDSLIRKIILGK